jgi:hypothetical protein
MSASGASKQRNVTLPLCQPNIEISGEPLSEPWLVRGISLLGRSIDVKIATNHDMS